MKQTLRMILPLDQLPAFFPLLQQGVWMDAQIGCSVMSLLTGQFGVAEDYVLERITTLFLDGKAVDDLETSYVKDGSTVALSSAMPGLVGTTMRRGGHLAAMRGEITCQSQQQPESGPGKVKIKLFNMVMAEQGASFLAQGAQLSNDELKSFLDEQDDSFSQSFGTVILGGRQIDPANLKKHARLADPNEEIVLKVEFKA
ncbi:MAG: hypothetical protein DRH08_08685 [Deltaproteobacteria bacterium]|nr:MAG: hypothetical protein DRH08_08685 [Deltaproteobacteria bacterium]